MHLFTDTGDERSREGMPSGLQRPVRQHIAECRRPEWTQELNQGAYITMRTAV